eukprot:Seg8770.1 transcript_id=Seg8770.1/GoldUCD/mRNA.D3Y31 product="hypothetical protein" protein_id=Seg8770.1/GoldUCD/D3Y31
MSQAHRIASENSAKSRLSEKKQYDKKMHHISIETGDRVLVRNLTPRQAPHKLRSHWEDKVNVIVSRKEDGPVYVVKPEIGTGRERTLHRNLRLPCNMLVDEDTEKELPSRKPCVCKPKPKEPKVTEHAADESDTDSEELPMFLPAFQPEPIVTLDNSSSEEDNPEITVRNEAASEEEADQASLQRNIEENLPSQSGLSPLAPTFSPQCQNHRMHQQSIKIKDHRGEDSILNRLKMDAKIGSLTQCLLIAFVLICFIDVKCGSKDFQREVLGEHNKHRGTHNASPLLLDDKLTKNATLTAKKAAESGNFERISPGQSVFVSCATFKRL